jgi:hypothetical protein
MDCSEANYRSCDQTYAVHFINVNNICVNIFWKNILYLKNMNLDNHALLRN